MIVLTLPADGLIHVNSFQGGSVRHFVGSAPICSPRSANWFITSSWNEPGLGGTQLSGTAMTRTSTSAPYLRRLISACANRCRIEFTVEVCVAMIVARLMMSGQRSWVTCGGNRNWLLKITQYRNRGIGRFGYFARHFASRLS